MRKLTQLTVIGIASLVMMACGFGGFVQKQAETQEKPAEASAVPVTAMVEAKPTKTKAVVIQVEKTPTPTTDPTLAARSCLAKTWQIEGLSDYVIAAVPPELAEEYSLEYIDSSGQAYLTFTNQDEVVLQADDLAMRFKAQYGIFQVEVTVSLDGRAIGDYEIDGDTVTIRHMDTSGLTASARAMNQDLIESDQIIASIPFVRPPYNRADFHCKGDTLELDLAGTPEGLPPLMLQAK